MSRASGSLPRRASAPAFTGVVPATPRVVVRAAAPASSWSACPLDPRTGERTGRSGVALVVLIVLVVLSLVGLALRLVAAALLTDGPLGPLAAGGLALLVPGIVAYVTLQRLCRSWWGFFAYVVLGVVAAAVFREMVRQRPPSKFELAMVEVDDLLRRLQAGDAGDKPREDPPPAGTGKTA